MRGGHFFQVGQLFLDGEFDELLFEPGEAEDFVDADEEVALVAVVFAGFDLSERWTKGRLEGSLIHGTALVIRCGKQIISTVFRA